MNDWTLFDQILREKSVPRQVMIYPERYMDQYNVARRRGAIKEMGKRGMSLDELEALTPFCRRYLRDIISNGSEPELPGFARKETDVNAENPTPQNAQP